MTIGRFWLLGLLSSLFWQAPTLANSTIAVAVGWNKPPYVIENTNSGYEVELVRELLSDMGLNARFVPIPYGRSYEIIGTADIQAAMTLSDKVQAQHIFFSDVYINYQNVAASLEKSQLKVQNIADLRSHSVVAFQNASLLLGEDFYGMTLLNDRYNEVPDQSRQVRLLFDGRTDVAVMDVNILFYFRSLLPEAKRLQKVDIHELFPPSGYQMGFATAELRDAFNQALSDFLGSEQHLALQARYGLYVSTVLKSHVHH